jgi:hypothetical protein
MVPIHDTDIAHERWAQAEWQYYELWEKVEVKLRRRKALWIIATLLVFLGLSSVPILVDRWPKWTALSANRKLAQQIGLLKAEVGAPSVSDHQAFRVRFNPDHRLTYTVEKVETCADPIGAASTSVVRTGDLLRQAHLNDYVLLNPAQGKELGVPGLVDSFCYDSLSGSTATAKDEAISGFGIVSVKDLAEKRTDRISLLIFKGPLAELSFE